MNNMIWLIRATRWVRNPPSGGRVVLVMATIAVVILLGTLDWLGWWPDWASLDKGRGVRVPR